MNASAKNYGPTSWKLLRVTQENEAKPLTHKPAGGELREFHPG
jgi:hypothetical protein